MEIKRYDVFFADLNPTQGREINKIRPVVVISPDSMNKYSDVVIVCPLTSQLHPTWRTRIQISCHGKDAEIAVDQLRAISKSRLSKKIDKIDKESAASLRQIIQEFLATE